MGPHTRGPYAAASTRPLNPPPPIAELNSYIQRKIKKLKQINGFWDTFSFEYRISDVNLTNIFKIEGLFFFKVLNRLRKSAHFYKNANLSKHFDLGLLLGYNRVMYMCAGN